TPSAMTGCSSGASFSRTAPRTRLGDQPARLPSAAPNWTPRTSSTGRRNRPDGRRLEPRARTQLLQWSDESSDITARGSFNGQELKGIPVLNPAGWFGKTWLLEIGGSYWPLFLIVEADGVYDAIAELADNEQYTHHIVVPPEDLADYPEEGRHYGPSGQVLDLDHLQIHGQEGVECPFPCTYH